MHALGMEVSSTCMHWGRRWRFAHSAPCCGEDSRKPWLRARHASCVEHSCSVRHRAHRTTAPFTPLRAHRSHACKSCTRGARSRSQVTLYEALLASPFRTADPAKADFFYVPIVRRPPIPSIHLLVTANLPPSNGQPTS
jgi:hypothetical protein